MASRLLVAGFDLLSESSAVRLSPDFSRGAGQPSVSSIQSTVLDGAWVTGRASGNRTITLPVIVRASSRLGLAVTANQMLMFVDSPSWALTFVPDGGFSVTYTCFRASVELTSRLLQDATGTQEFTITCEALPFGKSSSSQQINLIGSITVLDSFNTAPVAVGGAPAASVVSSPVYEGANAVQFLMPTADYSHSPPVLPTYLYSRSGLAVAVPAGGLTTLSVQAQTSFVNTPVAPLSPWQLALTVSGPGAGTYTGVSSSSLSWRSWAPVVFDFSANPLPSGLTVTGWQLTVPTFPNNSGTQSPTITVDYLSAVANSGQRVSSTNGAFLSLPNIAGTARCPIAVAVSRSDSSSFSSFCVHSPPAETPSAQALLPLNLAGNGSYTTSSSVKYNGTYSVWMAGTGTGGTVNGTLTFSQSAPAGGPTKVFPFTLSTGVFMLYLGEVTLPLTGYPNDSAISTTATVAFPGGATIAEVLLLDTRGQTVVVGTDAPSSPAAWLDEPMPGQPFGGVYSGTARSSASSVSGHMPVASTLLFAPGANTLLLHSPHGPMVGQLTYTPRWVQEATL